MQDRNDPEVYAVFHGKARVTESGADEPIEELAKRFRGADTYPFPQPGEGRLIALPLARRFSMYVFRSFGFSATARHVPLSGAS